MNTRNRPFSAFGLCVVAAALLFAAGCGRSKKTVAPPAPQPVTLTVVGTADLNRGTEDTGANSVVLRIYELAAPTTFQGATLEAFWKDDRAALGEELVGSRQILLRPGQTEVIEIQPGDKTQFIGVAADFRAPNAQGWRQVYAVSELRGRPVHVEAGADRIQVHMQ